MNSIHGEYDVSVDAKGRFLLPAAFKKKMAEGACDKFMICRGFENCLSMYTMDVWNTLIENMEDLNDLSQEVRLFKRVILSGATEVVPDGNDRVLLPKSLMDRAGIKKDMIMAGQGNKIELWDKDTYNNYLDQHGDAENFSKVAALVAGNSINLFKKKTNG